MTTNRKKDKYNRRGTRWWGGKKEREKRKGTK